MRPGQQVADTRNSHGAEEAAAALARHFSSGRTLTPISVSDLPLVAGERAFADVTCATARFYGTEVIPPPRAGYFENHPAFGRRWVSNRRLDARRMREAEAEARERWRDHTPARVVLTSVGLRVKPPWSGWLPFDHACLTAVSNEPFGTVLSYSVCAPLFLSGPAVPWRCVALRYLTDPPI